MILRSRLKKKPRNWPDLTEKFISIKQCITWLFPHLDILYGDLLTTRVLRGDGLKHEPKARKPSSVLLLNVPRLFLVAMRPSDVHYGFDHRPIPLRFEAVRPNKVEGRWIVGARVVFALITHAEPVIAGKGLNLVAANLGIALYACYVNVICHPYVRQSVYAYSRFVTPSHFRRFPSSSKHRVASK